MDKKMTSGEIAKKAGISQKAVRLYDEKGLLKPSEYSEGNYRLYDKEALLALEKIIALKQIGFSLEEIRDNLVAENNMDITESLNQQLALMEAKKRELERAIDCIKSVLVRSEGKPDWNNVAELARMIQVDQGADERHFDAMAHTADTTDWYVKIYNTLGLSEASRVLDLGSGFGKLWRNNWEEIPAGVKVDAIDLHGSWADNFAEFVEEKGQSEKLANGSCINIHWMDLEEAATWEQLSENEPYTYIIAHYIWHFIKDKELFLQRAASVLSKDGMFSINGYEVSREEDFWREHLEKMKLSTDFIVDKLESAVRKQKEFRGLLEKYFSNVENIRLSNNMRYDNPDELYERLCQRYAEKKKYFAEREERIKEYFARVLEADGTVTISMDSEFWHCYK